MEKSYDPKFLLKTETVFSQCNGYMGIRAAFDTKVLEESRGMFIGGIYHKAYDNEVMELVNCPDITEIQLEVNSERFSIDTSEILEYCRTLNVMTGELSIHLICRLNHDIEIKIDSKRFASFREEHLFCQNLRITPVNSDVKITLTTGINGQMTNSGVSHFKEVDCRVYEKKYMHMDAFLDDDILSITNTVQIDNINVDAPEFVLKRRGVYGKYEFNVLKNQEVSITKYNYIRDDKLKKDRNGEKYLSQLKGYTKKGYDALFREHKECLDKFWNRAKIEIDGATLEEEAAVCFAQYHMFGMAPQNNSIENNERLKGVSRMVSLEVVLEVGHITGLSLEEKEQLAGRKNDIYLKMISKLDENSILPGIIEFLDKIKILQYKTALGSASKSGKMILEQLKLSDYFDAIVDGNLIQNPKPDPEVFQKAADLLKIPYDKCIVVEDSKAGIEAARAGGMHSIGIGDMKILKLADIVIESTELLPEINLENCFRQR